MRRAEPLPAAVLPVVVAGIVAITSLIAAIAVSRR
jgi:hypothetical protein